MKSSLTPEACVKEAFEKLDKKLSIIAGDHNKDNIHNLKANHTEDEFISYIWDLYTKYNFLILRDSFKKLIIYSTIV